MILLFFSTIKDFNSPCVKVVKNSVSLDVEKNEKKNRNEKKLSTFMC